MDGVPRLPTSDLAASCREETRRRSRPAGDPSPCLELFRRAVVEDDQAAWQALYTQYRGLLGQWGAGSELELDDLVNETFARFWQGLRGHDFDRFPSLEAVLGYLRQCARSLAIDAARRRKQQSAVQEALRWTAAVDACAGGEEPLARLCAQELRDWLRGRLRDEQERVAFFLSYELGLRPAEVCARRPDLFPAVQTVYMVKERIVVRLANDPEVRRWWLL